MTAARDHTAASLSEFLRRRRLDNPWTERKGASTRLLYAVDDLYELDRLDFHARLIEEHRASGPAAADGSRTVVVTAGPPGAGKSTAVAAHSEFADYRHIDADVFKDPLLERAEADGLLEQWLGETLADDHPVAVREVSTFVHAESTVIANTARRIALAAGENLVVHGTLATTEAMDELLRAIIEADYRRVHVLDVEVDQRTATERALARWWAARQAQADPRGARFVPPSAIADYYEPGSDESTTMRNASAFVEKAEQLGFETALSRV